MSAKMVDLKRSDIQDSYVLILQIVRSARNTKWARTDEDGTMFGFFIQ